MQLISLRSLALAAMVVSSNSLHAAPTEFIEAFELRDRMAGDFLNKLRVGASTERWEASKNIQIGAADSKNGYATLADAAGLTANGPFSARFPIPATAKVITIEANITPTGKGWVCIGLGPKNVAIGNPTLGGLYAYVRPDGNFGCAYNLDPDDWESRKTLNLKTASVPSYDVEGVSNKFKLVYDRTRKKVSVWMNDKILLKDGAITVQRPKPDFAYVGFAGFSQEKGWATIDDFKVSFEN